MKGCLYSHVESARVDQALQDVDVPKDISKIVPDDWLGKAKFAVSRMFPSGFASLRRDSLQPPRTGRLKTGADES